MGCRFRWKARPAVRSHANWPVPSHRRLPRGAVRPRIRESHPLSLDESTRVFHDASPITPRPAQDAVVIREDLADFGQVAGRDGQKLNGQGIDQPEEAAQRVDPVVDLTQAGSSSAIRKARSRTLKLGSSSRRLRSLKILRNRVQTSVSARNSRGVRRRGGPCERHPRTEARADSC